MIKKKEKKTLKNALTIMLSGLMMLNNISVVTYAEEPDDVSDDTVTEVVELPDEVPDESYNDGEIDTEPEPDVIDEPENDSEEVTDIAEEEPGDEANDAEESENAPSLGAKIQSIKKNLLSANASSVQIRTFQNEFASDGTVISGVNVGTPVNSAEGYAFAFRTNFALSGEGELPAGAVTFTIPKQIIKDKNGNYADQYNMSVPAVSEYESGDDVDYVYYVEGDNIIVTNVREISAGSNGYFEVSYETTKPTYDYNDFDSGNAYEYTARISVDPGNGKTPVTANGNVVKAAMNTWAEIESTSKRYPTQLYRTWQSAWGAAPADAGDYYYLIWEIKSLIKEDITQSFTFTLDDVFTTGTAEPIRYKFEGQQWQSQNHIDNVRKYGYRYDYVLTRHPKSIYDSMSSYSLTNKVTAIVTPSDGVDAATNAVSSRTYNWQNPHFVRPGGHFDVYKWGNWDWHLTARHGYEYWDYARYDLDELQEGNVTELGDIKYEAELIGYPYPWTIAEGGSSDNPDDYGARPVKYVLEDVGLSTGNFDDGTDVALNPGDYDIQRLTWTIGQSDAIGFNDESQKFIFGTPVYNDSHIIHVFGMYGGDWIEVASYNQGTHETTKNSAYVESIDADGVVFVQNKGIEGWKIETENAFYYSRIIVTPYYRLTNSANVMNAINGLDVLLLSNTAKLTVYKADGTQIMNLEDPTLDRLIRSQKDSEVIKDVVTTSNNVRKKKYTIGWRIEANEQMTIGAGDKEFIKQNSGTFYDLLPSGSVFDNTSVQVETEAGFLDPSEYSFKLTPNYRGSGRTLFTINITSQAEWYRVYYATIYSWDTISDYGRDVLNPIAYQTGNDKIADGYADNGGDLTDPNKSLYVNVDPNSDAERFIYNERAHLIGALTAALSGLTKKVKDDTDEDYVYTTFTQPDSVYIYRLRYANPYTTLSKDMVLFDSLENYVNEGDHSEWKGTLTGIDVSQLVEKGIAPVVYLSRTANLDLEQYTASSDMDAVLANTSTWVEMSQFGDLSEAKAIAIDMREAEGGGEFVLNRGESVSAFLYMQAPHTVPASANAYPETYNNIYIHDTVIDMFNDSETFYIHQDYTTVKFIVTGSLDLHKVNEENPSESIPGISFQLYGTSDYGTDVNMIVKTGSTGNASFENVEKGTYTLLEYEGDPDWQDDHTSHTVVIDGEGKTYVDGTEYTGSILTITNKPRIHADLQFTKRDSLTNRTLSGAVYRLSGTSDYGNDIIKYATSKGNGVVVFEDVELGKYDVQEVEAPDRYVLDETIYTAVIDESGIGTISDMELGLNGKPVAFNDPRYFSFVLHKEDEATAARLSGTTFVLYGVSDLGTSYNVEKTTDNFGSLTFEDIEKGTYILQETVPATGYVLDSTKHIVEVDGHGTIYIDGVGMQAGASSPAETTINKAKWTNLVTGTGTDSVKLQTATAFEQNTTLSLDDVTAISGVQKIDDGATDYSVYVWRDGDTVNWWSDAGTVYLPLGSNSMFDGCNVMTSLDLSGFDTSKVTSMGSMFKGCEALTNLDVSGFNTSKVTDMQMMFRDCKALTSLDLSGFDTSNVTNMGLMFSGCKALTSLDVRGFDTSKVTNMVNMFANCIALTSLDVSGFDTGNVTSMRGMFYNCNALTSLDVSGFNTSKVTNLSEMFRECALLTSLDLSGWDTSKATDVSFMFYNCSNLSTIYASELWSMDSVNTSSTYYYSQMFSGCTSLPNYNSSHTNYESAHYNDGGYLTYKAFDGTYNTSGGKQYETVKVVAPGEFTITNEKARDGRITVTKIWNDGLGNADRPMPEITISTVRPRSGPPVATIAHSNWSNKVKAASANSVKVSTATAFERNTTLSLNDVTAINGVQKIDDGATDYSVYVWRDGDTVNWWSDAETVYLPADSSAMFSDCKKFTSLDLSDFNTSKVMNMKNMFSDCRAMTNLDLSGWDTSKVTDMTYMFSQCQALNNLDVSGFDTSNVTDMKYMFSQCRALTSLDLSGFDTSKVTDMQSMFYYCRAMTSLDLSGFDTSKVTNMDSMFYNCSSLTSLDVSGFDTSKVTTMGSLFSGCENLTSLDVSGFDTSNVTNMQSMFFNCGSLTSLDVSGFDTSNVTNMQSMFFNCSSLTSLDVSGFDTSKVTTLESTFKNCKALTTLDLSGWDTSNVTKMGVLFYNCSSLTSLDVSGFDTSKVTNMDSMFYNCSSLTSLDVSEFDTSNVTDMGYMFSGCQALTSLDVSGFDTSNVTKMGYMFNNCNALTSLDVSRFDTSNVTDMDNMFNSCKALTSLDVSGWDTSKVTNMSQLFCDCRALTSLDVSGWDTSNVTLLYTTFCDCRALTSLDVSGWDTSKVTNMSQLFCGCQALTSLAVSSWNTSNVTKMESMFSESNALTSLDLSSFDTSKVTKMDQMFNLCSGLSTIYVSELWNTDAVTSSSYMFRFATNLPNYDSSVLDKTNAHYNAGGYLTYKAAPSASVTDADSTFISTLKVGLKSISEMLIPNLFITAYAEEGSEETYSTSEDPSKWVKNGDVWTYTFEVRDDTQTFYVWESSVPSGYVTINGADSDGYVENPIITNDKTATIVNEGNATGSLTVEKIVTGTTLPSDLAKKFVFTITLTDASDAPLSGLMVINDVPFVDGVAKISLAHNESKTFSPLPAGYHYKVEEAVSAPFVCLTPTKTGTIPVEGVTETFTNRKVYPEYDTAPLVLRKAVTGNFETNTEAYTFDITFENLIYGETYYLSDGTEFAPDSHGKAHVTVSLHDGESVAFEDAPVGTRFMITEAAGDYISSYTVTDSSNLGLIAQGIDSNAVKNKALSTALETIDSNESLTVLFTNKKVVTAPLVIEKAVVNENNQPVSNDTTDFSFHVSLSNMEAGTAVTSTVGRLVADENGMIDVDITLRGGNKATFYNLPVLSVYTITEAAAQGYISSYKVTDANSTGHIVSASKANTSHNTELATSAETVNEGEAVTVKFTNKLNRYKDITVKKRWSVEDTSSIPSSVTVHIVGSNGSNKSLTLTAAGNWENTLRNLPAFNGANEITYTVYEEAVSGFVSSAPQSSPITVDDSNYVTIVNVKNTKATYSVRHWTLKTGGDPALKNSTNYTLRDTLSAIEATIGEDVSNWVENGTVAKNTYTGFSYIDYTVNSTTILADSSTVFDLYYVPVVSIPVQKTWSHDTASDRPAGVVIHLVGSDGTTKQHTLTAAENWKYTFTNLPYCTNANVVITWRVYEEPVADYVSSNSSLANAATATNGTTVTINNSKEVEITVVKAWANDAAADRPAGVVVHLVGSDGTRKEHTLTAAENWTYTFTDLPYRSGSNIITWNVYEDVPAGYISSNGSPATGLAIAAGGSGTITNSKVTTVTVVKAWANDAAADRPAGVVVHLVGSDGTTKEHTLTSAENWTYTFTNLPYRSGGNIITWKAYEDVPTGYTSSNGSAATGLAIAAGGTGTITNSKVTSVTVVKAWANDTASDRPAGVVVHLVGSDGTTKQHTLTAAENWTYTFDNLPYRKNGTVITWKAYEDVPNNYSSAYNSAATGLAIAAGGTGTITNSRGTSVTVVKAWANDAAADRPSGVVVHLVGSDGTTKQHTLTATENWTYTFTDLPYRNGGNIVTWKVYEDVPNNYSSANSSEATGLVIATGGTGTITNSRVTSVKVVKSWANDIAADRPAGVVVHLVGSDGTTKEHTLTAADNWTYTFTGLPYRKDGNVITWKAYEDVPNNYSSANNSAANGVAIAAGGSGTITNSRITSVTVVKSWANDSASSRPSSITVHLVGSDGTTKEHTLTAVENWRYTFTDLPYRKDGTVITWKAYEDVPAGYSSSNGSAATGLAIAAGGSGTITNRRVRNITVTKTWDDDDSLTDRPASITVHVKGSDGSTYSHTISPVGNTWPSYTFEGLPAYTNAGTGITYSVYEDVDFDYYESDATVSSPKTVAAGTDNASVTITNTLVKDFPIEKRVTDAGGTDINTKTVSVGADLYYHITITNPFSSTKTFSIYDDIPANSTYVAGSADNGGALTGNTLRWEVYINGGASKTVSFVVKTTNPNSVIENMAYGYLFSDGVENTSTRKETEVVVNYTPDIVKSVLNADDIDINGKSVEPGDLIHYAITVRNPADTAKTYTITDELPNGLTYDHADNSGSYNSGTRTVTWTVSVPAGGSKTVVVFVNVDDLVTVHINDAETTVDLAEATSNEVKTWVAKIVINKAINNYYSEYGTPGFIYHITDTAGHHWVRAIEITNQANGTATFNVPAGISSGTYTIAEERNARYRFVSVAGGTPNVTVSGETGVVSIGITKPNGTVNFVNEIKRWDEVSHAAMAINHVLASDDPLDD